MGIQEQKQWFKVRTYGNEDLATAVQCKAFSLGYKWTNAGMEVTHTDAWGYQFSEDRIYHIVEPNVWHDGPCRKKPPLITVDEFMLYQQPVTPFEQYLKSGKPRALESAFEAGREYERSRSNS